MEKTIATIGGLEMPVYSMNTVIVGSGAAGLNAADCLYNLGQTDIAIVSEGINMGTSRNTGSDKQTYYKMTLAGGVPDSVMDMAKTLFDGGSMHGDIALVEAALSTKAFYKLVDIGVPFPHNSYGEYIGYKTDHDPKQRATSAGPLTSRYMTEKLEAQVRSKNITIFDGFLVIGILTRRLPRPEAFGLVALDYKNLAGPCMGLTLFNCTNIIYATGGPAGMYQTSVYPESQTGATGIALEAGACGINLTESQYGIASLKFRWNLSGTYQQVIPRYISRKPDGTDEKEFLNEYFEDRSKLLEAIFLKGYQWPFDPRKLDNSGSSLIDLLVYNETQVKGRRVFLDYMHNPDTGSGKGELDFSLLGAESRNYLEKSGALFGRPVDRLAKMNQPAINLYKDNGIDLTKEYLEIAVCAQHNNGGLAGDIWWESNVSHFFPVGEVNGTFGTYRPGGSALNSTQVGSFRASQYINANYRAVPDSIEAFTVEAEHQVIAKVELARKYLAGKGSKGVAYFRDAIKSRVTRCGAHVRSLEGCSEALGEGIRQLGEMEKEIRLDNIYELPEAFRTRDQAITQIAYLAAIKEYILKGGKSRGSYLICSPEGELPLRSLSDEFKYLRGKGELDDQTCEVRVEGEAPDIRVTFKWNKVRPVPEEDNWFENIWDAYRKGNIKK